MIFFLFLIPVISKPSDVFFFGAAVCPVLILSLFTSEAGYTPLQWGPFPVSSVHPGNEDDSPNSSLDDGEGSLSQYLLCQQSPELTIQTVYNCNTLNLQKLNLLSRSFGLRELAQVGNP